MKPLVLLDVDGVVNDLSSLYSSHHAYGAPEPNYEVSLVKSHGHVVHIPEFMPGLIQALVENTQVMWLTTWREKANDEIVEALGIGKLPVVTDGGNSRYVSWKPAAASLEASIALKAGREVWWIEDFYGDIPVSEMPDGVKFIDTAATTEFPVLLPYMVPSLLTGGVDMASANPGVEPRTSGGWIRGLLSKFV